MNYFEKGDELIVKTKKRTFRAKAAANFNDATTQIYPLVDLDRGGQKSPSTGRTSRK